jgi:hypothetical protein
VQGGAHTRRAIYTMQSEGCVEVVWKEEEVRKTQRMEEEAAVSMPLDS